MEFDTLVVKFKQLTGEHRKSFGELLADSSTTFLKGPRKIIIEWWNGLSSNQRARLLEVAPPTTIEKWEEVRGAFVAVMNEKIKSWHLGYGGPNAYTTIAWIIIRSSKDTDQKSERLWWLLKRDPSFICDPRIAKQLIFLQGVRRVAYDECVKALLSRKSGSGAPRKFEEEIEDKIFVWFAIKCRQGRSEQQAFKSLPKSLKHVSKLATARSYYRKRKKHYESALKAGALDAIIKELAEPSNQT